MKTKILTDLVSKIGEKESLGKTDACQQEFHDPQDYRPVHPHDGVPVDDRPLLELLFCQIPWNQELRLVPWLATVAGT